MPAGLGFELAKRVLEDSESAVVVAGCRDPSAADDLKQLQNNNSPRVYVVQLDVSQQGSVEVQHKRAVINRALHSALAQSETLGLSCVYRQRPSRSAKKSDVWMC